jgi:NAD(P)-dependent dehydrogenase (short-subunit alcohol dehydrogenase family)
MMMPGGEKLMAISEKPVALVTGSSRGIGKGIALRLAKEGFTLVVNGVTKDPSQQARGIFQVKKLIEGDGGTVRVFRADVSSSEDRKTLISYIEKELGRIDLLVNNAGIEPKPLDILESSEERFNHTMAVNLRGPYFLTQQVAKRMIEWKKQGVINKARIAFITSVQGYMSNPGGGEYCMTKAALGMAAKLYAHRLGEFDIPVIEISPGIIESDMSLVHKDNINRMIAEGNLVTARWGHPDEVAAVVAAFARGDLDYSTGQTIEVGGGLGMNRL